MSIITWLTNKSVESFAKGIARAQLKTLHSLQKRKPELTGDYLYECIITMRPFYNSEKAKALIREAKASFERTAWIKTDKRQFGFRDVVSSLIIEEYSKGNTLSENDATALTIIEIVVRDIIPPNL